MSTLLRDIGHFILFEDGDEYGTFFDEQPSLRPWLPLALIASLLYLGYSWIDSNVWEPAAVAARAEAEASANGEERKLPAPAAGVVMHGCYLYHKGERIGSIRFTNNRSEPVVIVATSHSHRTPEPLQLFQVNPGTTVPFSDPRTSIIFTIRNLAGTDIGIAHGRC